MDIAYQSYRFIDQVLIQKEYEFILEYPVIIDIGANIGTFSFSMVDHAKTIFALEPVKENYDCIVKTIKDNNIKNVKPFQIAIGDKSVMQYMRRDGNPAEGGWRLDEAGDYLVDVRTLKDFMDSQNIEYADLVKIDVEGYEGRIIHAPYFPKDRIGAIIGEFHFNIEEDLKAMFEYMGFKYMNVGNNHFIARKK